MPVLMPFTENGLSVHFPDNNTFRLSDCRAHIAIKSKSVKEMDIGWFDTVSNTLWLVELKAFHNPDNILHSTKDLSKSAIVDRVIEDLLLKSIHTICQVNTDRADTMSCLPQPLEKSTFIKVVHLIRTMPGQDDYLNPMQDKLRVKLSPLIAIFNIHSVTIISYDNAVSKNLLPWVV